MQAPTNLCFVVFTTTKLELAEKKQNKTGLWVSEMAKPTSAFAMQA